MSRAQKSKSEQTEGYVRSSIRDRIMIIEFNHPNKHNPFGFNFRQSIKNQLVLAQSNDEVDAVLITGGAGHSFSVGGDFNEVKNLKTADQVNAFIYDAFDLYFTALKVTKPTIAAIDHYAIGIGFQLAMTFDIRIGTDRTIFSMPELKHGLSCTIGSCMLEHFLGRSLATQIIYECNDLDCKSLLDMSLLNRVVKPEKLIEEAFNYAKVLSKYPKNAYRKTKESTNKRLIQLMENTVNDSLNAHCSSMLSGENTQHLKKILKDKY